MYFTKGAKGCFDSRLLGSFPLGFADRDMAGACLVERFCSDETTVNIDVVGIYKFRYCKRALRTPDIPFRFEACLLASLRDLFFRRILASFERLTLMVRRASPEMLLLGGAMIFKSGGL